MVKVITLSAILVAILKLKKEKRKTYVKSVDNKKWSRNVL